GLRLRGLPRRARRHRRHHRRESRRGRAGTLRNHRRPRAARSLRMSTAEAPRTVAPGAKYHLATYGCQMNEYDSNLVGAMLEKRGLEATSNPEEADVFIVNTCSIRGGAEDRAYMRISQL